MRHLCFVNTTSFWGGGEHLQLEMAIAFAQRGCQVSLVAAPASPLHARATAAGLQVVTLGGGKWSWLNPLAQRRLTRILRRQQPDAVILHTSDDLKLGAPAARRADVPRIAYLRGLAVPVRDTVLNRYLLGKAATHVIANSEATRATILSSLRIPPSRVAVIYHGIDLSGPQPPPPQVRAERRIVIGNAGRLTAQKAQHELIAAAAVLRKRDVDFTLEIAGEGAERERLEGLIASLGLEDHVQLLGFVTDMDAFYRGLDVFALTSHWEGFGFVLAEAMRHGLPVVAYDVSSNPEIVADGETGVLVAPGDVEALADELTRLAQDAELRRALGAAGQSRVRDQFDLHRQLDLLEQHLFDQTGSG